MDTKSCAEIERLKREWAADPCFDIENTEGFEAYREELLAFRDKKYGEWQARQVADENRERQRVSDKAAKLGCTSALVNYIEELEEQIKQLKADAE